jgi:hypothetical protein
MAILLWKGTGNKNVTIIERIDRRMDCGRSYFVWLHRNENGKRNIEMENNYICESSNPMSLNLIVETVKDKIISIQGPGKACVSIKTREEDFEINIKVKINKDDK